MSVPTDSIPPGEDPLGSSGLILQSPKPQETFNIMVLSSLAIPVVQKSSSTMSSPPYVSPILHPVSSYFLSNAEISERNIIPDSASSLHHLLHPRTD